MDIMKAAEDFISNAGYYDEEVLEKAFKDIQEANDLKLIPESVLNFIQDFYNFDMNELLNLYVSISKFSGDFNLTVRKFNNSEFYLLLNFYNEYISITIQSEDYNFPLYSETGSYDIYINKNLKIIKPKSYAKLYKEELNLTAERFQKILDNYKMNKKLQEKLPPKDKKIGVKKI